MRSKSAIVNKVKIKGVNNPVIYIEGETAYNNVSFELIADNKSVELGKVIKNLSDSFYIEAVIPPKTKKIQLYLIHKDEKVLLMSTRNYKLKRIMNKIISIIKKRIGRVIYETCEGVGIETAQISEIGDPELLVTGSFLNQDSNLLEVYADKKFIKSTIKIKDKTFMLKSQIPFKSRKVTLYFVNNNRKEVVCEFRVKKITNGIVKYFSELFYKRLFYNKNIGVEFVNISGIKNPLFHIKGSSKIKNQQFKLLVNEKVRIYKQNDIENNYQFNIEYKLKKKDKVIKLFAVNNGKTQIVCVIKNRLIFRIIYKISEKIKNIFIGIKNRLRKTKVFFYLLGKGIKILWTKYHFIISPKILKQYYKKFILELNHTGKLFYHPFIQDDYLMWLEKNQQIEKPIQLKYRPLLSILIPVYNVPKKYLSECLDSILKQSYQNFEICIADDCSTNRETLSALRYYAKKDNRVKIIYREKNGHISNATNTALDMAIGEFVVLVDNDDTLELTALYEMVKKLNEDKSLDMIYSDEDKLDLNGRRCEPHFKPDFSPDTLLGLNYICHLTMLRTSIVRQIGGFTVGLEGAQDHDLFLRFVEKTNNICHIPKILYHWRMIPGSTAAGISNKSYALDKGKMVIEKALERRNLNATVEKNEKSTYYLVDYKYEKEPMISIIIPTRDYAKITDQCLKSIFRYTTYRNFEIILVNNGSVAKETFAMFDKYKKEHSNFKVIDINTEFNYSLLNNMAIKEARGEYVVLLNNDTEIIMSNWLEIMLGYAMQPHIGAVGVKLLYPDKTIQHGGVVLGLGGVASHTYVGHSREDLGTYGRLMVPYNYAAVTAACLMVKKDKYLEVNGLEEELKVAYNDVDFCIKLLKKGYYNIFLPQVELLHYESKSRGFDETKEKYLRFVKEQEYMYKKWKDIIGYDPFYNRNYSYKMWFMLDK